MATNPSQSSSSNETDSFQPKSSFIESVSWNKTSKQMTVTFKTGSSVNYLNVFEPTYLSFKQSPSHSTFYAKAIKGKLRSVPTVQKLIGQPKSTALHKLKQPKGAYKPHGQRNGLDNGLRSSLRAARTAPKQPGTVPSELYSGK